MSTSPIARRTFWRLAIACALAASPALAQEEEGAEERGQAQISDGSRINLQKKGFSIVPPEGWEVYTDHPQLTLLMQVPYHKGIGYQRTIQVASFNGPKYIDDVTAREFSDIIVRKFSKASASIEDYRIRNHIMVELEDGREGILFYSEFTLDGVPLMQAHILISSQTRHYLMTFTDIAEHFEDEEANQFLTVAWNSMISAQLDSRTPLRYETIYYVGGSALALFFLGVVGMVLRRSISARKYRAYAQGRDLEAEEEATSELVRVTGQASLVSSSAKTKTSMVASSVSGVSHVSSVASSAGMATTEQDGEDSLIDFDDEDEAQVG